MDLVPPHKYVNIRKANEWDNLKSVENVEDNSIDSAPRQVLHDLSNDIYVNQLMADAGAPTNPDAEVFEVVHGNVPSKFNPQAKTEKIVPFEYGFPPQGHFLGNDFQQVGLQHHGPMPAFGPFPLPYYAPPMFPINSNPYGPPSAHPAEQIITHSSLPAEKSHQYLPSEQQTLPSHKVKKQVEVTKPIKHDTSTSNIPETSQKQSSSVTNVQVPSTST